MSVDALREVGALASQGYDELRRRCPDLPALGGCLLLGRHYAHPGSRVLFLGLNPGGTDPKLDIGLQEYNYLLEGPNHAVYWTNARKCFSASPVLASLFRTATLAFCCPYRTADWSSLSDDHRRVLVGRSKPVLRRMVADCRPALIVVAGKVSLELVQDMLRPEWHITKALGACGSGTYQWAAYRGSYNDQEFVIAQVPHFSRANSSPRLHECATWLSGIATATGLTV